MLYEIPLTLLVESDKAPEDFYLQPGDFAMGYTEEWNTQAREPGRYLSMEARDGVTFRGVVPMLTENVVRHIVAEQDGLPRSGRVGMLYPFAVPDADSIIVTVIAEEVRESANAETATA